MSETTPALLGYADTFRCIGSACEDTCCRGWNVPIDQATYDKYQRLPAGPVPTLIQSSIWVIPAASSPATFAKIRMTNSNECPMLSENLLCRIQAEFGETFLPGTCASYPRIVHTIGGVKHKSLALSCPEAARMVLLNAELLKPDLLNPVWLSSDLPNSAEAPPAEQSSSGQDTPPLQQHFRPIQQAALALVTNRAYRLWQRLFLLGVFCRRLDSIANGELPRTIPAFLSDFEIAISTGALRPAMETLPLDQPAQLDAVLRLAGMMLHRSNIRPRFVECIRAFTAGIGNGPGATLESLAASYGRAHDRYFAPFFTRHPHIFENYLVNTILRCQFPFGREGVNEGAPVSMTREFALLTAQFALMKGLLIGVAGCHRDGFTAEHVVHTVQAASKHFEHHPEFLNLAYNLLAESGLNGALGLAILLRNAGSGAASGEPNPASPAIYAPGPQDGRRV